MKTMTLFTVRAHPTIGDDDPLELEIAAPKPGPAHEAARQAYALSTGIPTGLVHTKIVARKEQLAR